MTSSTIMPTALKRITDTFKRRGLDWITANVPYNLHRFAPVGLENVCRGNMNGADCLEYPGPRGETAVTIPHDLYTSTADFMRTDAFDTDTGTVRVHGEAHAWKIRRGRIYTNATHQYFAISQANRIVAGASYNHDIALAGKSGNELTLSARFFPEPVHFSCTVASLVLGGGPATNIFHWMMDALPRLHLIEQIMPLDDIDHFVVQGADNGFRLRSLEILGIPASKVHFFTDQLIHIQADELLLGSHPRGWLSNISPDWSNTFHRNRYLSNMRPVQRIWPKKIYISRRDSSLRGVANEEALFDQLKAHGYQEILLSEYNYDEKIALFHHAREVISMSGAGLGFLVYCQPGTRVLELFPAGFVHYANAALAAQADLDYHYLVFGDPAAGINSRDAQRQPLQVDHRQIQAVLDNWSAMSQTDLAKPAVSDTRK